LGDFTSCHDKFLGSMKATYKLALFMVSKGRQKLNIPASKKREADTKIGVSVYPT
jgi:hypothetical protein